jgi:serine/threonine protein kinase
LSSNATCVQSLAPQIKQYSIGEELGRGAFSHVCRGTHPETGSAYAIKIFSKSNLASDEDLTRFQREIDAMAYLRHDSLGPLHDFLWDDENFYLVLDLCPGGELFDFIATHDRISEPAAALVFQQVVSGTPGFEAGECVDSVVSACQSGRFRFMRFFVGGATDANVLRESVLLYRRRPGHAALSPVVLKGAS